jgi:phospholipid/cholesterol/gamma-HCH transport system permease protein
LNYLANLIIYFNLKKNIAQEKFKLNYNKTIIKIHFSEPKKNFMKFQASNQNFFILAFLMICRIGRYNLNFFKNLKSCFDFIFKIIFDFFSGPFYLREIFVQISSIGIGSIPIVALTGIFTGSVLALQTYIGFSRLNNTDSIPLVVVISMTRELGPVLTALMLSGRISSGIASEIGSMKISDQLNAMKVMGISHVRYLFRPRLLAILFFMPILTLITDIVGIFGGYLISVYKLNFNSVLYQKLTYDFLKIEDVISGIQKSFFFALIIVFIGYFFGFKSEFGSSSVSNSTKNAVVVSTVLILIFNYILTYFLFD